VLYQVQNWFEYAANIQARELEYVVRLLITILYQEMQQFIICTSDLSGSQLDFSAVPVDQGGDDDLQNIRHQPAAFVRF
jgi:hypothetical protein